MARGSGERYSSPAGPSGAWLLNAFWCNCSLKFANLLHFYPHAPCNSLTAKISVFYNLYNRHNLQRL